MIIDYESISVHRRGRDIGALFFLSMFEMEGMAITSIYDYPSLEWRQNFVSNYIQEYAKITNSELDTSGQDSIEHLVMESHFYSIYSPVLYLSMIAKQDETSFLLQIPHDVATRLLVSL